MKLPGMHLLAHLCCVLQFTGTVVLPTTLCKIDAASALGEVCKAGQSCHYPVVMWLKLPTMVLAIGYLLTNTLKLVRAIINCRESFLKKEDATLETVKVYTPISDLEANTITQEGKSASFEFPSIGVRGIWRMEEVEVLIANDPMVVAEGGCNRVPYKVGSDY
jgi:hypothetical protein